MKKILAITGIRSDYDLMSGLFLLLKNHKDASLKLLVGGAHMSPRFGHTIDLIRADGIETLLCLETLIDGDTTSSRLKTASIFLQGVIDAVSFWAPDLIIYAGDREETWVGAILGAYLEIPTVHFYGGDHTLTGHVDNPIRHAVSKLSTAHFVATKEHQERLMAIGEPEHRIFITGSLAIDNFVNYPLIDIALLAKKLDIPFLHLPYALVIFHPDPSEKDQAGIIMKNIMDILLDRDMCICVGYPNTDPANGKIIEVIDAYQKNPKVFIYKNLARSEFISLYKGAQLIIGNSSSGIMESSSIPIPAVNIGLRQRGRMAAKNVVFCDSDPSSISRAIDITNSKEFLDNISLISNPYGSGDGANSALKLLLEMDFNGMRLKTEDPIANKDRN